MTKIVSNLTNSARFSSCFRRDFIDKMLDRNQKVMLARKNLLVKRVQDSRSLVPHMTKGKHML